MRDCYLYMRCSGQDQVHGDTWERQQAAARRHAAANELRIIGEYREEAVSGKTETQHRPALRELLADLAATDVRVVVIEKLDRLARDLMVQESIVTDLQRRNVTLVSTMEPDLCSTDPTRVLMRQIMGAFAQYEKDTIVSRTRAARERIRKRGEHCEGRKPYGSRAGEAELIERIRRMFEEGYKWTHIANELNGMGIKPRAGKLWYPAQIGRILKRSRKEIGV